MGLFKLGPGSLAISEGLLDFFPTAKKESNCAVNLLQTESGKRLADALGRRAGAESRTIESKGTRILLT
jgi:hypothetical protein